MTSSTSDVYTRAIPSHNSSCSCCCHRSSGPIEPRAVTKPKPTDASSPDPRRRRRRRRCGRSCSRWQRHNQKRKPIDRALLLLLFFAASLMRMEMQIKMQMPIATAFSPPVLRGNTLRNRDAAARTTGTLLQKRTTTTTTTTQILQLQMPTPIPAWLLGTAADDNSESTATTTAASSSPQQQQQQQQEPPSQPDDYCYEVRDCRYRELKQVAALVVESFYDKKTTNIVTRNIYKLAELNRLQQNYAYPESRTAHRMLVVEAKKRIGNANANSNSNADDGATELVGFCDVDARPCATQMKLPRPYLSDLAVDPRHRRKGLARKLVEASERFVLDLEEDSRDDDNDSKGKGSNNSNSNSNNSSERRTNGDNDDDDDDGNKALWLWIRVEETNEAAIELYQGRLGYVRTQWSVTDTSLPVDTQAKINAQANNNSSNNNNKNKKNVWTLRKDLRGDGNDAGTATTTTTTSSHSENNDPDGDSSSAASDDDYVI